MFPDIDTIHEILNDIADRIPEKVYWMLSGGVALVEEIKYHKESEPNRPLYVLGEYINGPLGRSINIYYGSLRKVYEDEESFDIVEKLEEVLFHELTHHLESLAGVEDLRLEDYLNMEEYRSLKK